MSQRKAIQYMLLSTLFFSFMSWIIKYLNEFSSFQLMFFRSLGTLVLSVSYLLIYKIPPLGNQKKLLIARGLTGSMAMLLFFIGITLMSLGSVVSLRYTAPLFVALLAVIFLNEKIKALQWFFITLSFVGVLFVKGYDPSVSLIGLAVVLSSAILSAITFMLISKIGEKDHYMVIITYFMFTATVVGGVGSLFIWHTPKGIEWVLLIGTGLFGFVGQVFMTKAFQIGPAYKIAPFKYIEVVFSLLIGTFFFLDVYSFYSLFGMGLIISGLSLSALYKRKKL